MIVFPMAGRGTRFLAEGYELPKWRLELAGRTVLDWVFLGFQDAANAETVLIVVSAGETRRAEIERAARAAGFVSVLTTVVNETSGQADTVYQGLRNVAAEPHESITIFNIDTLRPRFSLPENVTRFDGWIECVEAEGHEWSFVEGVPGRDSLVGRVAEKERISSNCCTGIYYFKSRELFERAFALELQHPSGSELYVAPLYNHLIADGSAVGYGKIGRRLCFVGPRLSTVRR